jgi:ABC-type multidrug transport system fused ATPase/permease subunit
MVEKRKFKLSWLYASLSGFIFGLTAATRTSELLWLAPLLLLLWLFNLRKIGLTKLIIFLAGCLAAFLPVLYFNKILYHSYILGGYAEMNQSIINIKDAGAGLLKTSITADASQMAALLAQIKNSVFFFGFDSYKSAKMFYFYFVDMFPWLFWPACLGGIISILLWYKLKYRHLVYFTALMMVAVILILYYGSWDFHDNPNVHEHTIGNSYTRYWLPIYLGAIPFASLFFMRLTRVLSKPLQPLNYSGPVKFISIRLSMNLNKFLLRALAIAPLVLLSTQFVLFGSSEGLYYLGQRQIAAGKEWRAIMDHTENNSVIITQYHDKLLFPERKVVVGLFDDPNMIREYAKLARLLPTYYYNFTFPEETYDYLNRSRLKDDNLRIERILPVTKDFTLYRLDHFALPAAGDTASST